jgi:diadenosine tetraphosphate (Ap4A) HIT family hydrolase
VSAVSAASADCLFCVLARQEAEVSIVYEDEHTVVFMDIEPVNPGHVLVVPRAHATHLADLDPEDGARLFRVGQRAAAALRAAEVRCEGVNFLLADGETAGQEVFHVHLHVIPRFEGDGFGLHLPPERSIRPRDELDRVAAIVRRGWEA